MIKVIKLFIIILILTSVVVWLSDNPGKVEEIELPIHASNVSILDPKTGKPSRVKFLIEKDKKKRVTVSSNSEI